MSFRIIVLLINTLMTKRRILKGVNKGAITSYKVKKTEPPIVFEDDECYEEEEEERKAKENTFECPKCEKVFKNAWIFKQHVQSHMVRKQKCPYCSKKFRKENLEFHKSHCKYKTKEVKEEEKKEKKEAKKKIKFTVVEGNKKEEKKKVIPNSGNLITNYFNLITKKES